MAHVGLVTRSESAHKFAVAATGLGIDLITYNPNTPGQPPNALGDFIARSNVITVEYGCGHDTLSAFMESAERKLRPISSTIGLAHDPLAARRLFRDCGFEVADFEQIDAGDDEAVQWFARQHGWPVRLRASRWGPGDPVVRVVRPYSSLDKVWADSGATHWLLETWEPLAPPLAVVVARRSSGDQDVLSVRATPMRSCRSHSDTTDLASLRSRAISTTSSIVDGLDATGVVTVQFTCSADGRLLVDDVAYGPLACAVAPCSGDETLFTAHLRAILS